MTIRLHFVGSVAVVTVDRPGALNALNFQMLEEFSRSIDEIRESHAAGVVVVGAGDRAFCAGADVVELRGRTPEQHRGGADFGQQAFAKLADLPLPSVAVIRGPALGGGLELAMACTYRVAISGAKLGLPEIKLGLIPGYGGTQRLPRIVGTEKALEMITSGRAISADEAHQISLVDDVVPEGDAVEIGIRYLHTVSNGYPASVHLARQAVKAASTLDIQAGLQLEAKLFARAVETSDAREGMQAFVEKRAPEFQGR
ncbi:enoyl-CoA hydratase/isomerase family protein [Caballeronia sp. J97]|uniref:enoyl-CoA hydratase/isomerase family protein n=1 Tax=Caballeronia sp. J97 TaxID=2805429 RepID=UPI002AB1F367|nr:enoyl-CoA hydratase-related protein [Caballeronia sp. J97]